MGEWPADLSRGLYALQRAQKLCDTVIESSQEVQHVLHSCVLASASQHFAQLEEDPPFLVKCEQTSEQSVEILIELLYTGEVSNVGVGEEVLRDVWEAANTLCIPHIQSYVENLLQHTAHTQRAMLARDDKVADTGVENNKTQNSDAVTSDPDTIITIQDKVVVDIKMNEKLDTENGRSNEVKDIDESNKRHDGDMTDRQGNNPGLPSIFNDGVDESKDSEFTGDDMSTVERCFDMANQSVLSTTSSIVTSHDEPGVGLASSLLSNRFVAENTVASSADIKQFGILSSSEHSLVTLPSSGGPVESTEDQSGPGLEYSSILTNSGHEENSAVCFSSQEGLVKTVVVSLDDPTIAFESSSIFSSIDSTIDSAICSSEMKQDLITVSEPTSFDSQTVVDTVSCCSDQVNPVFLVTSQLIDTRSEIGVSATIDKQEYISDIDRNSPVLLKEEVMNSKLSKSSKEMNVDSDESVMSSNVLNCNKKQCSISVQSTENDSANSLILPSDNAASGLLLPPGNIDQDVPVLHSEVSLEDATNKNEIFKNKNFEPKGEFVTSFSSGDKNSSLLMQEATPDSIYEKGGGSSVPFSSQETANIQGKRSTCKFDPRVIQFLKKKRKLVKKSKSEDCEESPLGRPEAAKPAKVRVKLEKPKAENNTSSLSWSELKSYVEKDEKVAGGSNAQFQCNICGVLKNGYENFLGHKLRHAGVVPFHCKHCGKGFYRKTDGQRHEQRAMCKNRCSYSVIHSNVGGALKVSKFIKEEERMKRDGKKWFKCSICEKIMVGYETFLAHKFDHAGIKPFCCHFCEVTFSRKTEWRKHILQCCTDRSEKSENTSFEASPGLHDSKEIAGEASVSEDMKQSLDQASIDWFHTDIGEANRERLRQALQVLEESDREVLMGNLAKQTEVALEKEGIHGHAPLVSYPGEEETTIIENNEAVYQCSMCLETFTERDTFALHKLTHSQPVKAHSCQHCSESFDRKWDLNAHVHALHNVQSATLFTCQTCMKTYTSKARYRNHFNKKNILCQMSDEEKIMFERENGDGKNVCDLCGKQYSTPCYLQIHKESHEGRHTYVCAVCGQTFLLHSNLNVHMKRHRGQKHFACNICGKRFVRNCEMQQHQRSHSEEHVIRCDICGKQFKHKNSLQLHKKLHGKIKQYLCDLCGKAFSQKGNLEKHKKETHASQYNYNCTECEKKFYTEGGLVAHKKTKHSSLRPFACHICLKTFAVRINLTRHMATHSDQKPFGCPECNKPFRAITHIRRHLMAVHNVSRNDVMAMNFVEHSEVFETLKKEVNEEPVLQTEYVFVCQEDIKQEDCASDLSRVNTGSSEVVEGVAEEGIAMVTSPQLVVLDKDGIPIEMPAGFVLDGQQVFTEVEPAGEGEGTQLFYYTELK